MARTFHKPDCPCCGSSSSSSDGCAGWYCCEETGEVRYFASCAERDAFDCGSSSSGSSDSSDCGWGGAGWYKCTTVCQYAETCADYEEFAAVCGGLTPEGPYEDLETCQGA